MRKPLIPLAVLAAAAAAYGVRSLFLAPATAPDGIRVSGTIEATEAQTSFRVAGRVIARPVSEGEAVTNGQLIACLDRTELEQEARMRRAEAAAAQATLDEFEVGARPEEVEQAEAALEVARAEAARATNERTRQRTLFDNQVISSREIESAQAACDTAAARVREAEAHLTLVRKGPRDETLRAARARRDQAREAAALAETRLEYADLRAPLDGIVLATGAEPGEYVLPGTPVATLGDVAHPWLRAYVDETDLGRIRVGQSVQVTTDTPGVPPREGRLAFVSPEAEFTPKTVQTPKERVKLVYRIKITLDNPDLALKPGMPADGDIPFTHGKPREGKE